MEGQNLFWLSASVLGLGAFGLLWSLKKKRLRTARAWPVRTGRIVSTDVRLEERPDGSHMWMAQATYAFELGGETRTSRLRRTFLLEGRARQWAGRYPAERAVKIHCNPADPGDSAMFDDEQASAQ